MDGTGQDGRDELVVEILKWWKGQQRKDANAPPFVSMAIGRGIELLEVYSLLVLSQRQQILELTRQVEQQVTTQLERCRKTEAEAGFQRLQAGISAAAHEMEPYLKSVYRRVFEDAADREQRGFLIPERIIEKIRALGEQ